MAMADGAASLNRPAPDFTLPGVDGRDWSLADASGPRGTVVAFICNHCPYVVGVINRIVADAATLQAEGVGFVAVSANDPIAYPQDSFPRMVSHGYSFPGTHSHLGYGLSFIPSGPQHSPLTDLNLPSIYPFRQTYCCVD